MFAEIGEHSIEIFFREHVVLAPVLLLAIEEAGIPVPIPGDLVIAYVGYQVSLGHLTYTAAFFILLTAVLSGSSLLYYLSYRYGNSLVKRFGPYLHINEKKLRTVEEKFKKYGPWVIIIGRHIPGFRIPITIFSGMSDIRYKTFLLSTIASVIIWIPINLAIGAKLGHKTVELFHGHKELFFLATIPFILFILYIVSIKLRKKQH